MKQKNENPKEAQTWPQQPRCRAGDAASRARGPAAGSAHQAHPRWEARFVFPAGTGQSTGITQLGARLNKPPPLLSLQAGVLCLHAPFNIRKLVYLVNKSASRRAIFRKNAKLASVQYYL